MNKTNMMPVMDISNYLTNVSNNEDIVYLKSKLLPVNMRIFTSSKQYRDIVLAICDYIKLLATTKMNGYKKPHGMSCANIGIPFNIIGVVRNRGSKDEYCQIFINPIIIKYYGENVESMSNCGSVILKESIPIIRSEYVDVEYFDEYGKKHISSFNRKNGSFTIQHEIDHNLGILITDYKNEK